MKSRGFGTSYETEILRTILDRIEHRYDVRRTIQYPVSRLLDDSLLRTCSLPVDTSVDVDLVWSFCYFEQYEDSERFIRETLQKTTKYIMIVIQNSRNAGVGLHWIYHKLSHTQWDHGIARKMRPRALRSALKKMGLRIVEEGFFDVPWFILDVYECGSFLRRLVPASLVDDHQIKPSRFESMPNVVKSVLAHHFYVVAQKI